MLEEKKRLLQMCWKAGPSWGDYHEQVKKTNYKKWVKDEQLLNLELLRVLDNTLCHNIRLKNC